MARIGLLEDNTRIAHLCATMLHYAGHEVTIYTHPSHCLHALLPETAVHPNVHSLYSPVNSILPVEVLILDLSLPEIPGIEVMRRLQSDPQTQTLPLIVCTAASASAVADALTLVPRAGFVEKPFKIQTLTSAIIEVLELVTKNDEKY